MNSTVAKTLNLPESKVSIMPSVASKEIEYFQRQSKENFNVLSVGRFVPLKGFDVTIRAFAAFYKTLPETERSKVKLTLVGKGPSEDFLKEIIQQEGIESAVHIIPWIERDKLTFIYQAADLFLFPSHEGAGMVVAEAMSYGLPILCFDNCGPGEFINKNCGLSIPYQDYDTCISYFRDDLIRLYQDRNRLNQLSNGARRQHQNRFTWEVKGEQFRAVYESLLPQVNLVKNEIDKENNIRTPAQ